jgi:hypothetical protein
VKRNVGSDERTEGTHDSAVSRGLARPAGGRASQTVSNATDVAGTVEAGMLLGFELCLLLGYDFANRVQKFLMRNRLDEMSRESRLGRSPSIDLLTVACERKDTQSLEARDQSKMRRQLVAVHDGQAQIDQCDRGSEGRRNLQCRGCSLSVRAGGCK